MSSLGFPILSSAEVADFEGKFFGDDAAKEWAAMQRAGRAIAAALLRDFQEIGGFPSEAKILVLVGKGHNGGDALIAAEELLRQFPSAHASLLMVFGERGLRPLARGAYESLLRFGSKRVARFSDGTAPSRYDLSLDGIFGFNFRPPASPAVVQLAAQIEALPIRLRAAVDLPSGGIFRADFTYATGIVKSEILDSAPAGRLRFLDLGFFRGDESGNQQVLDSRLLGPLAALRSPATDKRTYGHAFILGGSRNYPGAVLMSVLAALRSGVGLVTAFVPESLATAFAARAPEAMWVGWPETPEGSLALEGRHLLDARLERATVLTIGPGLGREAETLALVTDIVKTAKIPVVLDADALQPEIVKAARTALILTPHAGEFARIAENRDEMTFAAAHGATLVLKGPVTRVLGKNRSPAESDADDKTSPNGTGEIVTYHSFFGGPVLARGGSGDLLAGLIGGLLAQTPTEPLVAVCRGVVWHGLAADLLARTHGQVAVQITQLLDFLPDALRESTNVS